MLHFIALTETNVAPILLPLQILIQNSTPNPLENSICCWVHFCFHSFCLFICSTPRRAGRTLFFLFVWLPGGGK